MTSSRSSSRTAAPAWLLGAAAGVGAVLVFLGCEFAGFWHLPDRKWLDWLQQHVQSPVPRVRDSCAVVAVDSSTLTTHGGGQWPLNRLAYATALQSILPYSARGVGFEMLLAENEAQYTVFDGAFALQASRLPSAVFSASAVKGGQDSELPPNFEPIPADPRALARLNSYQSAILPLERFSSGAGIGFHNLPADGDGIVRGVPIAYRIRDRAYPSFILRCLMAYEGARASDVLLEAGGHLSIRRRGEVIHRIPLDRNGRLLIRFRPTLPPPPTIGLDSLVLAAMQNDRGTPLAVWDMGQLRDQFVFITRADPATYQPVLTPLGIAPPANLHVAAWRTIQSRDFIKTPPFALRFALCAAAAVFLAAFAIQAAPPWPFAAAAFVIVDLLLLAAWLFHDAGVFAPITGPLAAMLAATAAGTAIRLATRAPSRHEPRPAALAPPSQPEPPRPEAARAHAEPEPRRKVKRSKPVHPLLAKETEPAAAPGTASARTEPPPPAPEAGTVPPAAGSRQDRPPED